MDNKKNLLILIFISIIGCIFAGMAYFTIRSLLFHKGYALSDVFSPKNGSSEVSSAGNEVNQAEAAIPGVSQTELRSELISLGFSCSEPELSENNLYRWVCWKDMQSNNQEVYIFSRNPDNIDFLDMNITQADSPSDQVSLENFMSVVEIIDTQRHISAVESWIDRTLPKIDEIRELEEVDFGEIHYRLYGLPEARSLEIGQLPE